MWRQVINIVMNDVDQALTCRHHLNKEEQHGSTGWSWSRLKA
mgnify:CR=1 FL=1